MSNQRRVQAKVTTEMIKIGKNISKFSTYSCRTTNENELKDIINSRVFMYGPNCDLNDIDVSLITDMSFLFYDIDFTGDISRWDVSNVVNMKRMFTFSSFNGDISEWNVSNVLNMMKMFVLSKFTGDISNWKINKKCDTHDMLFCCDVKEEFKPKSLQK